MGNCTSRGALGEKGGNHKANKYRAEAETAVADHAIQTGAVHPVIDEHHIASTTLNKPSTQPQLQQEVKLDPKDFYVARRDGEIIVREPGSLPRHSGIPPLPLNTHRVLLKYLTFRPFPWRIRGCCIVLVCRAVLRSAVWG